MGFLSMRFGEYNLTVEYYRAPFLVFTGRPPQNSPAGIKMTHEFLYLFLTTTLSCVKENDYLVYAGVTILGTENITGNNLGAIPARKCRPGLTYNPDYTLGNGTWDDGGQCAVARQQETTYTMLEPEPGHNQIISTVIKEMDYGDRKVQFLNITHFSQFRYDGHPSHHLEPGTPVGAPQDCSHWCLPGIPDIWNEILYANLLSMGFRTK
ncbi:unnamed protein product [Dovyalis caffra]|uniref:Trichome birefringence-like C-terminal domain-containing protein n=1 Tax=Dovyalis caffra TaxID=77055 RepID=A0AAV1RXJ8_9ROSI|nr:unnamed protein product [Dovyalis caffra]